MEQQLDAMLKAVTPSNANGPVFFDGTRGHGTAANQGFLREDAVLAVILVTDEDDCSIPDSSADLFAPPDQGSYADTPVNLRCPTFPELQHPVQRYYDGLVALKPQNPKLVVFAAIAGIPTSFIGTQPAPGEADAFYDAILNDPQMQFAPAPDAEDPMAAPRESCVFGPPDDPQSAFPPRRIVETARLFGSNSTVQSICTDDFTPALDNIIEKISDQLTGACLPRELTRSQEGSVDCDLVELVRDDGEGPALCIGPERKDDGPATIEDAMGNEIDFRRCLINQVTAWGPGGDFSACTDDPQSCLTSNDDGWYYDDFSADVLDTCEDTPQRIAFIGNAEPRSGSTVRIECARPCP